MKFESLRNEFDKRFGLGCELITSAPGRLEVLGNHTDYNAGLTLSCAVNFRCYVAIALLDEPVIKLASTAFDRSHQSFSLHKLDAPKDHWSRYVLGLVDALNRRGYETPGFALLVDSEVPRSAGVSSSAALEMAALTGLVGLMGIDLPADEMARIGQESESRAVGAQTGLLDQLSSLLGRPERLIQIDFQSLETRLIPAPPGWCFVAVDSGIKHDLTKAYNARRLSCESAAAAMGVESLRQATHEMLHLHRDAMPAEAFGCATHIIDETQRVRDAADLLAANDLCGFGQLLFDSHQSSRSNFHNSCPELDALVAYARDDDRCLGARLSGGGFGGISIHLVSIENAEAYRADIINAMHVEPSTKHWSAVCEISGGATRHPSA